MNPRLMGSTLPPLDRFPLENVARRIGGQRIGNLDHYLAFTMGTQSLLASVLIFDLEGVSVGTLALNSHVRPASRTAEGHEKLYSENGKRE